MRQAISPPASLTALLFPFAMAVGIGLLWSRSYQRADVLAFFTPHGDVQALVSVNGAIVPLSTSISLGSEQALSLRWEVDDPKFLASQAAAASNFTWSRNLFGFGFVRGGVDLAGLKGHWCLLRCPDWCPVSIAALGAGAAVARRWTRRQRRLRGLCTTCGYDLRASLEGCPECGAPISRGMCVIKGSVITDN